MVFMKKLLFASFSFLLLSSANAQTKQETMDFIAGKMQKYLVRNEDNQRRFISYENGIFKYDKRLENDNRKYCGTVIYRINLNRLVGNYDGYRDGYIWVWQGKGIITRDFSRCSCCEDTQASSDEIEIISDINGHLFNFYLEDGLFIKGYKGRIQKAIDLLKKYNQQEEDGGLFMD
jgi:hypothetical protein